MSFSDSELIRRPGSGQGKKYLVMLGQPNAFSFVGIFDVNIFVVSCCPLIVFEDGDKTW